jgi:glutamate dehydrogenase
VCRSRRGTISWSRVVFFFGGARGTQMIRRLPLLAQCSVLPRRSNLVGKLGLVYTQVARFATDFPEKPAQMQRVMEYIRAKDLIPPGLVEREISSFYDKLGIDKNYFKQESDASIGDNIIALYGSKVHAMVRSEDAPVINLKRETSEGAIFIHNSTIGQSHPKGYEKLIDEKYLDVDAKETPYRMESYLSSEDVVGSSSLRCYLINRCDFVNPTPEKNDMLNIKQVSDKNFLSRTTEKTQKTFQRIMANVLDDGTLGPTMELIDLPEKKSKRLIIGYRRRSTKKFFSAITDAIHYHDLYTTRKFVDQFSNGVTIVSFYLSRMPEHSNESFQKIMQYLTGEASLLYCLPENTLIPLAKSKTLSGIDKLNLVTECVYANVGWVFCQHFLKRLGSEYSGLTSIVDMGNIAHMEVLANIKKKLRSDTFTRQYILDIINSYPHLIKLLYSQFEHIHSFAGRRQGPISEEEIRMEIKKAVQNRNEYKVT